MTFKNSDSNRDLEIKKILDDQLFKIESVNFKYLIAMSIDQEIKKISENNKEDVSMISNVFIIYGCVLESLVVALSSLLSGSAKKKGF